MLKFDSNNLSQLNFKTAMKKPIPIRCAQINDAFEVETMEGTLRGKKGDWLMVGVNGEVYPCDREIFEKTYQIIS